MEAFVFKPSNEHAGKFYVPSVDRVPEGLATYMEKQDLALGYYVTCDGKRWDVVEGANGLELEYQFAPSKTERLEPEQVSSEKVSIGQYVSCWYREGGGEQKGPLLLHVIKSRQKTGTLSDQLEVRRHDSIQWYPLYSVAMVTDDLDFIVSGDWMKKDLWSLDKTLNVIGILTVFLGFAGVFFGGVALANDEQAWVVLVSGLGVLVSGFFFVAISDIVKNLRRISYALIKSKDDM